MITAWLGSASINGETSWPAQLGFRSEKKLEEKRRNRKLGFVGGTYRDLHGRRGGQKVHENGRDVAQLVVLSSACERKRMRTSSPSLRYFWTKGYGDLGLG